MTKFYSALFICVFISIGSFVQGTGNNLRLASSTAVVVSPSVFQDSVFVSGDSVLHFIVGGDTLSVSELHRSVGEKYGNACKRINILFRDFKAADSLAYYKCSERFYMSCIKIDNLDSAYNNNISKTSPKHTRLQEILNGQLVELGKLDKLEGDLQYYLSTGSLPVEPSQAKATDVVVNTEKVPSHPVVVVDSVQQTDVAQVTNEVADVPMENRSISDVVNDSSLTVSDGVIYGVQLLASRNKATADELKKISQDSRKVIMVYEDGWYKYVLTAGRTMTEAKGLLKELGFEGAFIVAYHNGKRITTTEALKMGH